MNEFKQVVILADGTELPGTAGLNEMAGDLWIWLGEGIDIQKGWAQFSKPKKTVTITARFSEREEAVWNGYTAITLIRQDNGKVTIRMRTHA